MKSWVCGITLVCCLLVLGCATAPSPVRHDPWFARDKAYHFLASSAIAFAATTVVEQHHDDDDAFAWSLGLTLTVGMGKELYDEHVKRTFWSWRDMAADLVGGIAGGQLAIQWD